MATDKHDPAYPSSYYKDNGEPNLGIPLRLEIATRLAAGTLANQAKKISTSSIFTSFVQMHLALADEFIKQHNKTSG